MKIYEISSEIRHLETLLNEWAEKNEGDITGFPHQNILDTLQGNRDKNLLYLAGLVKEYIAEAKAQDEAAKAIKAKAESNKKRAEYFKRIIEVNINKGEKLKNALHSISWRKSESVVIDIDPEELPNEFKKIKIEADKTKIKEYITNCGEIDGVYINTKQNIQVR